MQVSIIPREQQLEQRWRNDGGSTREIARAGAPENFDWRASVARIDASGPFSTFPDCLRLSTLLDGGPLTLIAEDSPPITFDPRMRAFSYRGDEARSALLLGTHAELFNLMIRPKAVAAQLLPRPLVGSMVLFGQPAIQWLVYLVSGAAELRVGEKRWTLASGDAALIHADGASGRAVLDGGGEVVLAKLEQR
jgi:uncharacterized protein